MDKKNKEFEFDFKKDEIIKHNRMIESAFGSLSLNSFKLLMFLSSYFSVENMVEMEESYKLSFRNKDFLESINYTSTKGYTEIKKYLRELKKADVELPEWEDGEIVGTVITGFIDNARVYNPNTKYVKKGTTTIRIDKALIPYLYKLKVEKETTILRYELMKKFTSYYSARIYELLIRWKNSSHRKREFELKELKEKLGIKDKYSDIRDLEKKVLKIAKREINEISDILMDYRKLAKEKTKRITHIEFTFKMKYEQEEKEILTDKQKDKLMEIASKRVIGSNKTAEDFYSYALGIALEKVNNKNSKTAYFKYIESILKDDKVFIGQLSMFTDPELRAAANKKAEKSIEESNKWIEKQEENKKNGVGMPEEIKKKLAELNKNYSFDDEE